MEIESTDFYDRLDQTDFLNETQGCPWTKPRVILLSPTLTAFRVALHYCFASWTCRTIGSIAADAMTVESQSFFRTPI